jgi:uncharacterized protein YdeI (YjbR/CyaY-like superfamily)
VELFNEAIVFGWKAPGRRVYVEASWLAESCRRHHSTEAAARAVSPRFFATPHEFAAWLDANAATEEELLIGFYTRSSARASMTWVESVDEVLCVGWIDGVRKNIDEHAYQIRFTPRKPGSTWSAKNIERVRVLGEQGRMRAAGLTAFSFRRETKSRIYSYEQSE